MLKQGPDVRVRAKHKGLSGNSVQVKVSLGLRAKWSEQTVSTTVAFETPLESASYR